MVTADTLHAILGTPPADIVEVGPFVAWRRGDGHGLDISTVYAGRDPSVAELAEIIVAAHQRWWS